MTSKEIMALEQENVDCIVLYRERMFWRAYERSAYALCAQVHPFRPMKRCLKVLDGEALVYVGFPTSVTEKHLSGQSIESEEDNRLVVRLKTAIDEADFMAWKAGIQSKEASSEHGVETVKESVTQHVAARLRHFNLADSTPLECMTLVTQLKAMLQ